MISTLEFMPEVDCMKWTSTIVFYILYTGKVGGHYLYVYFIIIYYLLFIVYIIIT